MTVRVVSALQAREDLRTEGRGAQPTMAPVARASMFPADRNTLALVARLMQGRVGLLTVAPEVQRTAVQEGLPLQDRGALAIQGRVGHAILDPVVQAACAQPTASSDLFQSKQ